MKGQTQSDRTIIVSKLARFIALYIKYMYKKEWYIYHNYNVYFTHNITNHEVKVVTFTSVL